jgi:hypothetical protein
MSDSEEIKSLHSQPADHSQYLAMSLKAFRRNIEKLSRRDLIILKDYLDTRGKRDEDIKAKSQCAQNRLSILKILSRPLPTYFMHAAQRMLSKEAFREIYEAAVADRRAAMSADETKESE